MTFNTPTSTVLYTIEEAIKAYRKLCTKNITAVIPDITVDQALILIIINDNNSHTQMEIARMVFKDYASITRILKLMEDKEYLYKKISETDKRRSTVVITEKGKKAVDLLQPVIKKNRETALQGLSETDLTQLFNSLSIITNNCNS